MYTIWAGYGLPEVVGWVEIYVDDSIIIIEPPLSNPVLEMRVQRERHPPQIVLTKHWPPHFPFPFCRWSHNHSPTSWWLVCIVHERIAFVPRNISNFNDQFWSGNDIAKDMVVRYLPHGGWLSFISFSYVDLPRLWSHNCLTFNARGCPCVNTTPKPLLDASHSKTNVLVKSQTTKMSVVHMDCFKAENACFDVYVH